MSSYIDKDGNAVVITHHDAKNDVVAFTVNGGEVEVLDWADFVHRFTISK